MPSKSIPIFSPSFKYIKIGPDARLADEDGEVSVVHVGEFPLKSEPTSIISWCPKMNLLLMTRDKSKIHCFRMRGEEIYTVDNGSEIRGITCHEKNFCLSGANKTVKIYDSNDGKLVKKLDHEFSKIEFIHWSNTIYRLQNKVLKSLPAIYNDISYNLDYLVTQDRNSITFTFNKVLNINIVTEYQIRSQVSPALFEQVYLDENNQIIRIDIPTESRQAYADSMTLLCQTIEYLERSKTTLNEVEKEIKSFYIAINRYLSNLETEVKGNLLQNLSDMLLTGNIPDETKDFWVNQFGERGFKKMDKLCENAFEQCHRKVFQYLIAPMERVILLLSELEGTSKWRNAIELDLSDIANLIKQCQTELKTYTQFMWDLKEEKEHYVEFFNWWKEIVDKFADKETTTTASTSSLLEFLHSNLLQSKVLQYITNDFDTIKYAGESQLLSDSQQEISASFQILLDQVDEYHQSHVEIYLETEIYHPTLSWEIRGSTWGLQTVEASLDLNTKKLSVSRPNDVEIDTVSGAKAFEFREKDLVVLAKDGLYILDHAQTVPTPLPELPFEPEHLAVNSKFIWITDKDKVHYAVLKLTS
ncbi:hypothetical protein KGF57_001979 [Candida theae]|uniref:Anaphase-promoting complex subunit 4 n=1 Tax=Candida theae TaxID=1198502 RepID=A0AAD5BGL3_9ASCO|nr:uncharacterized protein KGF57_001979 [Candida theae]KAI5960035.1 hypothetical protein KGF57_001979 [Candida theae]